jgi:hypothetical protein
MHVAAVAVVRIDRCFPEPLPMLARHRCTAALYAMRPVAI